MLWSLGRCCLEKVDLLMAGGAAEVLPVSLSCPLPLLRTRPPSLLVCCFFVFTEMGANSTASGRLEIKPISVWQHRFKPSAATILLGATGSIYSSNTKWFPTHRYNLTLPYHTLKWKVCVPQHAWENYAYMPSSDPQNNNHTDETLNKTSETSW
jgi:hypothetical protein